MLSYTRLLEANNAIQTLGDDTYWLCVTRTVQESKLFPVPSYMLLSYLCCFYRYPELLRKVESRMSAEEIGDRARAMGGKFGNLPGWGLPTFYLLGREMLINFGMLHPEDCAGDVAYVMDFWRRFKLAQQREDGHLNAREFGQRVQLLPERRIQRFHADLHGCTAGDRLHKAAQGFLATVSQYGFLVSCESRVSLNNSGPYNLGDERELIVREFSDLAEGDYPWLDGVAGDIPYNNLTVTMAATGCHFYLMDDWGSFESRPEFTAENLSGVGLYTSDALSEGFVPVGMGSPDELADTFETLTDKIRTATVALWKRVAGWSRDQMMDAGAITYFSMIKDFAHIAGVYDVDDWMTIDARADRFRPLLNDEFGRDFLGEMVGLVDLPSQRLHDYAMMQHNNNPVRYISHIPYAVLNRTDAAPALAPIEPGVTHLGRKQDRYTTTAGSLTLADYNARAAAFRPVQMGDDYRFLCDTSIKYRVGDATVDALYRDEQQSSPSLRGKGAGLSRADVEKAARRRAVSGVEKTPEIEALIAEFERSGLRELHVKRDGFEIYLSADGNAPGLDAVVTATATRADGAPPPAAPVTVAAPAAVPASWPEDAVVVHAPYLGTFYRSPKPGSEPYVEVGDTVTDETEVCLVEVMKLFTAVRADIAGTIHAVLAQDGAMVTADQPLFVILPA